MRHTLRGIFAFAVVAVLVTGAIVVATEARAACRMAPECWVNADCDAICGTALGKCVRNKCPIKICKCS
jgi:heme A synthase